LVIIIGKRLDNLEFYIDGSSLKLYYKWYLSLSRCWNLFWCWNYLNRWILYC